MISEKGGKLHFHAPIGAIDFYKKAPEIMNIFKMLTFLVLGARRASKNRCLGSLEVSRTLPYFFQNFPEFYIFDTGGKGIEVRGLGGVAASYCHPPPPPLHV